MKFHCLPVVAGLLFVMPCSQVCAQAPCTIPLPGTPNRIVLHQGPAEITYQDCPAPDRDVAHCEKGLCRKLCACLRRKCRPKGGVEEHVEVVRTATILPLASLTNESAFHHESSFDFPELRSAHRLEVEAARFKSLSMLRQAEMESTRQILERAHRVTESALAGNGKMGVPKLTTATNESGQVPLTLEARLEAIQAKLEEMDLRLRDVEIILEKNLDKLKK